MAICSDVGSVPAWIGGTNSIHSATAVEHQLSPTLEFVPEQTNLFPATVQPNWSTHSSHCVFATLLLGKILCSLNENFDNFGVFGSFKSYDCFFPQRRFDFSTHCAKCHPCLSIEQQSY